MAEQASPQVLLVDRLARDAVRAHQLGQVRLLQLERIGGLQVGIEELGRGFLGLPLGAAAHVLHASLYREVVNGLLDGAVDDAQPDRRLLLLADTVHARYGLQLQGGVEQGLAQEHVACVDQIQAAGMRAGVEEKHFCSWVLPEAGDPVRLVERRVSNPVPSEGQGQDVQEFFVL